MEIVSTVGLISLKKAVQIFKNFYQSPEVCLWTRKFPLHFESYPDPPLRKSALSGCCC